MLTGTMSLSLFWKAVFTQPASILALAVYCFTPQDIDMDCEANLKIFAHTTP